jgi:hypothetical protein
MSHRNLVLGSVLLVIVVTLCVYGVFRLFAHLDCFEISVYSPSKLESTMDYIAIARWERMACIADLEVKNEADTERWSVVEYILVTISEAKGGFDSVAIWLLVPGNCEKTSDSGGRDHLEYGVLIAGDTATPADSNNYSKLSSSPEVVREVAASPVVREAIKNRRGKMPVLASPDGGHLSYAYSINEICYYDEDGAPRSVSSKKYWRQVLSAAGKR